MSNKCPHCGKELFSIVDTSGVTKVLDKASAIFALKSKSPTDWEKGFIETIESWDGQLSAKQQPVWEKILKKYKIEIARPTGEFGQVPLPKDENELPF